jgi:hypothetical protein
MMKSKYAVNKYGQLVSEMYVRPEPVVAVQEHKSFFIRTTNPMVVKRVNPMSLLQGPLAEVMREKLAQLKRSKMN